MILNLQSLALILILGSTVFESSNKNSPEKSFYTPDDVQELRYDVRPRYLRPVNQELLSNATMVSEIIPGYPVNWISSYVAVDISVTTNKKIIKASGTTGVLTDEQKEILKKADLGSDINVHVKYKYTDPSNSGTEDKEMQTSVNVVAETAAVAPENDAYFDGGYKQMKEYFNKKGILRIFEKGPEDLQKAVAGFTVNEFGEISNPSIITTSGNTKIDAKLIDAIKTMPLWKPGKDANGNKVSQEFIFSVNKSGC